MRALLIASLLAISLSGCIFPGPWDGGGPHGGGGPGGPGGPGGFGGPHGELMYGPAFGPDFGPGR
jgi:hypothetical protein